MHRIAIALILGVTGVSILSGQSFVVGTAAPDGKIRFDTVEEFLIEQGKKVKLLPEQTSTLDPNVIKRLQKVDLSQAGTIRNDGTGRLVRLNGQGKPRDIVLPEEFTVKTPIKLAEVPGRFSLTAVRSKKNKQSDTVAPEAFFVYLSGASPDEAVLQFLAEDWAFKDQTEQLNAMEGFVASFKDAPAVGEFRGLMERKLRDGLEEFEDGGPDKNLRALQPFAMMAAKAFPSYMPVVRARDAISERIQFLDHKMYMLKSLAALGDWDKLLAEYQDFERYQWSFAPMIELRRQALEESARMHAQRAIAYRMRTMGIPAADTRGDHEAAIQEVSLALDRDPGNKETRKLLDAERVLASQIAAAENEAKRKPLAKGSPQDVQFRQNLAFADRSIQDKDYAKAQEQIQEAETLSPGSPEILLRRARLIAAQDRLTEALRFLDQYDTEVSDPGERQKGQDIRNDILYDLDKRKSDAKREIDQLRKDGEYSKLNAVLQRASKLDPGDPDFQYQGGLVAAVLRDGARAKDLLTQYRMHSNSLEGDLKKRDRAERLLNALAAPGQAPAAPANGTPNWFSGRKLAEGVFYCPESLAFQVPIDSVMGNKVRMAFTWDKGRLQSIQTSFEDDKGRRNYALLATPGASDADAAPAAAGGEEPGAFFFQYFPNGQVRAVRTKRDADLAKDFNVHLTHDDKNRARLVDSDGLPDALLPSNAAVDTRILRILEGPVATIVAGNSVFNPFLWDGLHYFSVRYDAQGRASSAEEWNADNLVRFTWDQDRLTEIRAYRKGSDAPYYRRTISYMGPSILGEDFTLNGKSGKIRYVYNGRALTQIKIDNDGKDWIAKPRS